MGNSNLVQHRRAFQVRIYKPFLAAAAAGPSLLFAFPLFFFFLLASLIVHLKKYDDCSQRVYCNNRLIELRNWLRNASAAGFE